MERSDQAESNKISDTTNGVEGVSTQPKVSLKEMIQNQQTKSQGVKGELKIMHCPHVHRRHYAKKMCMSCYHRIGRTKKAWACPHPYKLHYSKGLCQNCYLSKYYHDKKA